MNAPQQQFVTIVVDLSTSKDKTTIKLPTWRPGRYQLANFAKNIKHFIVYDDKGKPLSFNKVDTSSWVIDTSSTKKIKIQYKYYAAEMNAGSTYFDASQLYVNPVNCCVYCPEKADEQHEVELNINKSWKYAGPLKLKNNCLIADNFQQLADSPFICSNQLQHSSYKVGNIKFNVWFNGLVKPDWDLIKKDFKAFTEKQLEKFLEFPTNEYHFLFQILPYKIYHGVEHEQCTVITLGPSYAVFGKLYKELLGVSSHELYHTWNVKAIRPKEMYPYDFSKENFSKLGYITEGITTYQGDLFLFKSGVFNEEQYFEEMNAQLQKHFDNYGRFNYSVAESSWDTWLDGYEKGVPGRKVSIYTEGCLLAFITDVLILKATDNLKCLDDVMRSLYFEFAQKNKGITEADYKKMIKNIAGSSFDWLFEQYHHGTKAYETLLVECFEYLGIEMKQEPVSDKVAAYLGVKTALVNNKTVVYDIYPSGSLDLGGIMLEDEIIALNDVTINNDLADWLSFFWDDDKEITVNRKGNIIKILVPELNRTFYQRYWISKMKKLDKNQQNAYDAWVR